MTVEDVHAENLLSGGWCNGSSREGEEELVLHIDGGDAAAGVLEELDSTISLKGCL